jgi:hypothetical protein
LRARSEIEDDANVGGGGRCRIALRDKEDLLRERPIHVVTAEGAVAARRLHLEDAVVEHEDRDVERPAAEIEDSELSVPLLFEPVGERGRGGLVEEAQDVESRETARVFRRLPLRVVEIRRHGDDRTADAPELVLREALQRAQDLGAHFDRREHAIVHLEAHDVRLGGARRDEFVGTETLRLGIVAAASHEALHAHDRLARVLRRETLRRLADDHVIAVVNDARKEGALVAVFDRDRALVFHVRDEGVRRAEIDPDRARRRFRIEDLEEPAHDSASSSIARTSSRKRL